MSSEGIGSNVDVAASRSSGHVSDRAVASDSKAPAPGKTL